MGRQVVTGAALLEELLGQDSLYPRKAWQQNLEFNVVGGGSSFGKGSGKGDGSNGLDVIKLMMDQMAAIHAQHMYSMNLLSQALLAQNAGSPAAGSSTFGP